MFNHGYFKFWLLGLSNSVVLLLLDNVSRHGGFRIQGTLSLRVVVRSFGSALKPPIRLGLGDRRLYVVKVDSDRGGRPLSQEVAAVINRQFGRHDMTRHTGLCLLELLVESLVLMMQLVEIFELYFRLLAHS